jgi:asparagine synthase (glutamine-hydrolysing)
MCGVIGSVGSPLPSKAAADRARDAMRHRGPDGEGSFYEDPVFLGHRRLAILDLSDLGAQPMTSADGRYVIVYNGELYNSPEIRVELAAAGLSMRSRCDTEVLLEAIAQWGIDHVRRFNGIFAFALWDRKERELTLCRDHFVVKPLYVCETPGGIAFASESYALRILVPDLDLRIDPRRALQLLTFGWIPEPHTLTPAIRKLPPGHLLTWKDGRVTERRFWDLLDEPCGTHTGSLDDLTDELAHLMDAAVGRQLMSDVPVGAFLSGGLDSSSLVARMVGKVPRVDTYTIKPTGESREVFSDDLRYARSVAKHLGVALTELEVSSDITDLLPFVLRHLDDPIADPAAVNTWMICKMARDHGSVVVLSGQGGDELFGGYTRHLALLGTQLPLGLGRPIGKLARGFARLGTRSDLGPLTRPIRRIRKIADSLGDPPDRRYARLSAFAADPQTIVPLLSDGWQDEVVGFDPLEAHIEAWRQAAPRDALSRALYVDVRTFMPSLNLLYSDKMAAATSVELRVPYLDLELARFAWSVPSKYKIRRGTTKFLLKRTAERWLPKDAIYRSKRGFGAPVRDWLRGDMAGFTRDLLLSQEARERGAFDPRAVSRALDDHISGAADHGYMLYAMLTLELWCKNLSTR